MLKGGFDPEYSRAAPGTLLLEAGLKHAFASGLRRVELGGGDDAYKLRWTSAVRERDLVQAFPRARSARSTGWGSRWGDRSPRVPGSGVYGSGNAPATDRPTYGRSSRQARAQARVILSTKPLIRRYAATRLPSRSWPGRRSVLKAVSMIRGFANPTCSSRLAQSFGD